MPTTKMQQRRKATPSSRLSGKNNSQQTIGSFTKVSKAIAVTAKDVEAKPVTKSIEVRLTTSTTVTAATTTPTSSRKRKAAAPRDDDDSSSDERTTRSATATKKIATPATKLATRARSAKKSRPEPASRKRGRSPSVSDSEASTINAGDLFKRLRLEASPAPATPPLTPDASGISDSENTPDILPDEVLSLVDLHTALLKTLTLHYAHNGSNTPADLRRLCPDVARAWRKRKVTSTEIQTCLGVLSSHAGKKQPFVLLDYGHNKICIELDQSISSSMFSENHLNALFYENLQNLWRKFFSGESTDGQEFLRSLPKAAIKVCESFTKAAPIFAKGQQRLEDLKQGIAAKKLEKAAQTAPAAASNPVDTPMVNTDGSKMSLLDRIRAKSLAKAQAPAGLTPAQLERRAALQRAAEVSALVGMLSRSTANAGGGRMSFPMTTMLEKLKDTFRMGISREEGAACVRLLGKEIAPEWIRVVVIAGRENVVIDTNRTLSKGDVERRVQPLL